MNGKKLTLLSGESIADVWQANYIGSQLQSIGCETTIKTFTTSNHDSAGTLSNGMAESLITDYQADILVQPLKDVSIWPVEGVCIAALSQRFDPAEILIIRNEAYNENLIFKIKDGAIIGTDSLVRQQQMKNFRPDVTVAHMDNNMIEIINILMNNNELDGIVVGKSDLDQIGVDLKNHHVIRLHPKEFTPAAGQGVIACTVRSEDIQLRKLLMQIHNYDTASCTNVERSVLKSLAGESKETAGVYCEKDLRGNYHCSLVTMKDQILIKVKCSMSTTFGMADELIRLYQLK